MFAGFAPRLALLFLLFFTDTFQKAFDGWFFPLIGIILLPYTTLFYAFAVIPLGQTSVWGWFCVLLGFMMDLSQLYAGYVKRNNVNEWSSTTA